MIANWIALWSLHFGIGHWDLNKWAFALLKREDDKYGPTLATIEISNTGARFTMFTQLNHHAELLGIVFAEKYVEAIDSLGAVSDSDFERWIQERDSNIAKGVSYPSESAYNTVFGKNGATGCEFG